MSLLRRVVPSSFAHHHCYCTCVLLYLLQVCDLTSWVENHPGGYLALVNMAGKDATDNFTVSLFVCFNVCIVYFVWCFENSRLLLILLLVLLLLSSCCLLFVRATTLRPSGSGSCPTSSSVRVLLCTCTRSAALCLRCRCVWLG